MEFTKNKLPIETIHFFNELSEYIGIKPLFYGSVQRYDYFHGHSDIDVDIFSENIKSTMNKMQHFLGISKKKFKKVVWKLINGKMVYGFKTFYKNEEKDIYVEFSVYNKTFEKDVLQEHLYKTHLPLYISLMLMILKFCFYKLQIINRKTYIYYKNKILSLGIGLPEDKFVSY